MPKKLSPFAQLLSQDRSDQIKKTKIKITTPDYELRARLKLERATRNESFQIYFLHGKAFIPTNVRSKDKGVGYCAEPVYNSEIDGSAITHILTRERTKRRRLIGFEEEKKLFYGKHPVMKVNKIKTKREFNASVISYGILWWKEKDKIELYFHDHALRDTPKTIEFSYNTPTTTLVETILTDLKKYPTVFEDVK